MGEGEYIRLSRAAGVILRRPRYYGEQMKLREVAVCWGEGACTVRYNDGIPPRRLPAHIRIKPIPNATTALPEVNPATSPILLHLTSLAILNNELSEQLLVSRRRSMLQERSTFLRTIRGVNNLSRCKKNHQECELR